MARVEWAAYASCAWALAFGALHIYWGLGGSVAVPFSRDEIRDLMRNAWFVALGIWGVTGLCIAGGLLALALVRPWGLKLPRWLLFAAARVAGMGMMAYDGLGFLADLLRATGVLSNPVPSVARLHLWLWDPYWFLGGVLFSVAACSQSRKRRARRAVAMRSGSSVRPRQP